jgi:hypothetical protein
LKAERASPGPTTKRSSARRNTEHNADGAPKGAVFVSGAVTQPSRRRGKSMSLRRRQRTSRQRSPDSSIKSTLTPISSCARRNCALRAPKARAARHADGQLTVMLYAPVRAIFRCGFPLDLRPLPSISAAEHALLECSSIGKASNVTGLTIAKIERRLGDRGTARAPMRPDEIPVNLIYGLVGARGSGACQQDE